MGRGRSTKPREPNGKPSRAGIERGPAPTSVFRLRAAALAGVADARWGTQLGRLNLQGRITDIQRAAGERWAERAASYRNALGASSDLKAIDLDRGGGSTADVDSEQGEIEAKRHRKARASFEDALVALKCAGRKRVDVMASVDARLVIRVLLPERVVRDCCERGIAPSGFEELRALRAGLDALSDFWGLTSSSKSRHVR